MVEGIAEGVVELCVVVDCAEEEVVTVGINDGGFVFAARAGEADKGWWDDGHAKFPFEE